MTFPGVARRYLQISLISFASLVPLTAGQLAIAQRQLGPGDTIIGPATKPRPPSITAASSQTLIGGAVQINSPNATLTFTDTAAQKDVALRNMGGNLHFTSIIRSELNLPGRSVDTSMYQDHMVVRPDGNIGVGTREPTHRLTIVGGPTWTSNGWKGSVELENGSAIAWRANSEGKRFGMGHTNGGLYFFRTTSDPASNAAPAVYDFGIADNGTVNVNGTLAVKTIEIQGADLAERFDVRNATSDRGKRVSERMEQGFVVSIDPDSAGALIVSDRPYDRRVAGVISGAGGIEPGVVMGQDGSASNGRYPVALKGRVYCWADASSGPILPGDLLTTSSIPGHAMKVADYPKAQGAIVGKAMTRLERGTGLVLILVTLQ
jgi:hypothetical protein